MNQSLLNTPEDLEWLRSTHCPTLPLEMKCVVLHGNEDFPELLECYDSAEPLATDKPYVINLQLKRQADEYVAIFGSLDGFIYTPDSREFSK